MRKTLFILFLSISLTSQAQLSQSDIVVYNDIQSQQFSKITDFATYFLGTPYVSHTLDGNDSEQLVVNLRQLDCTTFVETVLALYLSQNQGDSAFCKQLQTIRYRDGVITDYASRLHYFTDWIDNNESLGLVKNITANLGKCVTLNSINFMSAHTGSYKQLCNDTAQQQKIAQIEAQINAKTHVYIPKNNVATIEAKLHDGDIIGLVTNIAGLDIMHVGFAKRDADGKIHFVHASSDRKQVVCTNETLHEYLQNLKRCVGIVVVRVNESNIENLK